MISTRDRKHFISDVIKVNDDILDDAIQWIGLNIPVQDVYDEDDLHEWAVANGYEKV